jgi:hypothetical protein
MLEHSLNFQCLLEIQMPQLNSTSSQRSQSFTLDERFQYGSFTVAELRELKNRSNTGFYEDVKSGLVLIEKRGRKTIIHGPIARKYLLSQPIDSSPKQGS